MDSRKTWKVFLGESCELFKLMPGKNKVRQKITKNTFLMFSSLPHLVGIKNA